VDPSEVFSSCLILVSLPWENNFLKVNEDKDDTLFPWAPSPQLFLPDPCCVTPSEFLKRIRSPRKNEKLTDGSIYTRILLSSRGTTKVFDLSRSDSSTVCVYDLLAWITAFVFFPSLNYILYRWSKCTFSLWFLLGIPNVPFHFTLSCVCLIVTLCILFLVGSFLASYECNHCPEEKHVCMYTYKETVCGIVSKLVWRFLRPE